MAFPELKIRKILLKWFFLLFQEKHVLNLCLIIQTPLSIILEKRSPPEYLKVRKMHYFSPH